MALTDRSLISKQELAKRWGVTMGHIAKLEADGVIKRTEVGRCMYPLKEVLMVEGLETEPERLGFLYKEARAEVEELKRENYRLRKMAEAIKEALVSC